MRPLLIEIPMNLLTALAIAAGMLAWCVVALRRASPVSRGDAIRAGLQSILTFGSKGSTEKTDISVPGSLGTVALALGAWGLFREPVKLPIFGYAAMAFCGFTATAIAGWKTGPKLGVPPQTAIRVAFLCAFFGILGSRLFYVIEFRHQFTDQPAQIALGRLRPLPGQTLDVRSDLGLAQVAFVGSEDTPSAIFAKLGALEKIGVTAEVIKVRRHMTEELVDIERGIMLKTKATGPEKAHLVVSGSVLAQPLEATGYAPPWWEPFAIWHGGLVYYGGMIFGTAAVLFFVRSQGQRMAQIGDLASSVGALGIAFGRVGCFLNGCCWGRRAELPWSVRFPVGSPAWLQHVQSLLGSEWDDAIGGRQIGATQTVNEHVQKALIDLGQETLCHGSWALHPVQVYAILLDLGMFAILFPFVMFKVKREWQTFFLWFIVYGVVRFIIEHFRGDHEHFVPIGGYALTPSQQVSVLTIPFAIAGFVWASKKGRLIVPWTGAPAGTSRP